MNTTERNVGTASVPATADAPKGLQEIHDALIAKAETAMKWYESRQQSKKRGARYTRSVAIILGALTAILPSIIALLPERVPLFGGDLAVVRLNPIATIFGIAAATVILFDRFYGFSSSWIRFITTYQEIQANLEEFRIGWRKQILKLNSNQPPTDEQIIVVYDFLAAFLKSVNDSIRNETQGWVTEFRGALSEIDKAVDAQKSAAAAAAAALPAKGALTVSVTEFHALDGRQWTLQLDNRKAEVKVGQPSASLHMLDPGIYKVRTAGERQGAPVAAEYAVIVEAGKVTELKVDKLG